MHILRSVLLSQQGIFSCCSANEYVLRAVLRRAKENERVTLIEATANQVNQYGGYTGMTPAEFYTYIETLSRQEGVTMNKVVLGGDHLGPLTWTDLPEADAMEKAHRLIEAYVLAGFTKIHIDTSMKLADDAQDHKLPDTVIARRGAALCQTAERAFDKVKEKNPFACAPIYVIGSEVPIPGGVQEDEGNELTITQPEDLKSTIDTFETVFRLSGLSEAWQRVIAVVVQPGVEFGDDSIHEYCREDALHLTRILNTYSSLVYEGHSTDYQIAEHLKQMAEDGIAILKVGPALTFALREALFALADIEEAMYGHAQEGKSGLKDVLETVMLNDTKYWENYYNGTEEEVVFKRKYSYSDRIRYYLPDKQVKKAIEKLISNLNKTEIPLSLISQYMPMQYIKVREKTIKKTPMDLVYDKIGNCLADYEYACFNDK